MTLHNQLDLFGDYDRKQERAALWRQPATCPHCGTTEPNGFVLEINHGAGPGQHSTRASQCEAQKLLTCHITYFVKNNNTEALKQSKARGIALNLDVKAIEAAARAENATA